MTTEGGQTAPPQALEVQNNVFIVGESPEERARRERKRQLRGVNARVWDGETGNLKLNSTLMVTGIYKLAGSLDSSLKKNTAFIKRLRMSLNAENQTALLKDIAGLSLEKYIPEIVGAASEGLQKCKTISDILAAVEVISALHQRFGTAFTPPLAVNILRALAPANPAQLATLTSDQREKEESARLVRQRVFLRVTTELWLVNIIRTIEDAGSPVDPSKTTASKPTVKGKKTEFETDNSPLPLAILKELLGKDRDHVNLPILVAFVKNFAYDVLGVKQTNVKKPVDVNVEESKEISTEAVSVDEPLCTPALQEQFRVIVTKYFNSLKAHIIKSHKHIREQGRRNKEAYVKSGEVFADREAAFQALVKTHEKLVANAQVLADALGLEMPDLPDVEPESPSADSMIRGIGIGPLTKSTEEFVAGGIWEDEETKRFYEDIIDLKGRVPPTLLEDAAKSSVNVAEIRPASPELLREPEKEGERASLDGDSISDTSSEHSAAPEEKPSLDTTIANKGVGQKVDILLMKMAEATNRDVIDSIAVEFIFLNSKASRNRLIKKLIDIPRNRQDVLPHYSRLVATLSRYVPDIGKAVVEELSTDFRRLQRKKTLTDARFLNIRYLSELIKFRIVPQHVIFHIFKVLLDDFSHANIELVCQFLESCGRFLFLSPDTNAQMAGVLETMKRKMDTTHLSGQERAMLQNAFYYCNPPERPAIQQKERSPMELFIRKMMYIELSKKTVSVVLKKLRMLHWEDPEIFGLLLKIFTKIWKLKYSNIYYVAQIAASLMRYHPDFVIMLVDAVFEHIRSGLELNLFVHNQRRLAMVRYLGELYNFRVLETGAIFDTLYLIVGFGYDGGRPRPGAQNPLDMPNDFFRIHLVCGLLETCGQCFDRGSSKKKLDQFLAFFQYYIHTKDQVSMDVKFEIQDLFEKIRPNAKILESIEEAAEALNEIVSRQVKLPGVNAEAGGEGSEGTSDKSDDELDEPANLEEDEPEDDEEVVENMEVDEELAEQMEDEEVVLLDRQVKQEVDEEFDREFARIMSEALESRKATTKVSFDVEPPSVRSRMQSFNGDIAADPQRVQFAVMSRRNKQMKMVEVPTENSLAQSTLKHIEDAKAEKQRIKNLVLNLDRKNEEDERRQTERTAASNGVRINYGDDKKQKRPSQSSWNYKEW